MRMGDAIPEEEVMGKLAPAFHCNGNSNYFNLSISELETRIRDLAPVQLHELRVGSHVLWSKSNK